MKINTSLVFPTYNFPNALKLVLESIKHQSVLPEEVIIADDGSEKETKEIIESMKKTFPVIIKHVWQEDSGNRKAMIMNKAIALSKSEYIICIDGDIILHEDFVKDHIMMAEDNVYLYGSRVFIKESKLKQLFFTENIKFNFFSKGIRKRTRTLYIPFLAKFYKKHSKFSPKMRGCNFSFWKNDFVKVNGYNEEFTGWGAEDTELAIRMHNAGIYAKKLKFAGIVYHIYHPEQTRDFFERNDDIQRRTEKNNITFTEKGIKQYL